MGFVRDLKDSLDSFRQPLKLEHPVGYRSPGSIPANDSGCTHIMEGQEEDPQSELSQQLESCLQQLTRTDVQLQGIWRELSLIQTEIKEQRRMEDERQQTINFVVSMLQKIRAEGVDTPRLACVLAPWKFELDQGLASWEQKPRFWMQHLKADNYKRRDSWFIDKSRLFLVCARTHKLVPCGPLGQGYKIHKPREWVRRAISIAKVMLQVTCATFGAIAAAPLGANLVDGVVGAAIDAANQETVSRLQAELEALDAHEDNSVVENLGASPNKVRITSCVPVRNLFYRARSNVDMRLFALKGPVRILEVTPN